MNEITPENPLRVAALQLYRIAHGFSAPADELALDAEGRARVAQIESELTQQSAAHNDAMAAWCTLTAIIAEMRQRTLRVIAGAQTPPHQPHRNPRLLVFQDALEDLAELLDREIPLHPEAAEWWRNSRSTLLPGAEEMRDDLRRLARLVEELEADAGVSSDTPDESTPKLRAIDKIENIVGAIKDVADQLQETVNVQRERIVELQAVCARRN